MNDMYDTCPPVRPSIRTSQTRVSLTNPQPSLDAKVVIMGSAGVGKTSLVMRYVEGRFGQTTTTTGAFFYSKKATVDGTKVRLQIWDTAGQERFRSMAPMYYRGASAAILVYDITSASSFEDVKLWIDELKRNCDPDLLIYIVGAKADLAAQGQRIVTSDRARLALHTWFPPPPPPISYSAATTAPGTPKTEGVYDSYIRPRLTSLASSRSVPFGFGSVSLSTLAGVTTGRLPSPMAEVSSGASATSTSSSGAPPRRRPGHVYSRSFAGRLEDEGYGGEEPGWSSEERGRAKMRTRSGGRDLEISAAEFARGIPSWSARRGRSTDDVVVEDEETEEEESWGLGKGMQLREVSAKDDRGVQNLFDAIIKEIIKRKDVLERDRIAKERDSIIISPSWNRVAEEEEAATSRKSGGSCCAV
ncbi:Ras-like GTP-binding protein RYL2 OS=Yarrowia lipolytica (strain CLIB 122 / E 150) GN=RYL2 PE=3 SV=2 [Rhizoctonia solani AG-1 IB]|uniref:Ras-like GTP-binding protein RYL2 n=1 Tax=Thanatephorus cucumeris (strain AG1-IB / isolate 7/3/14) TaxID=1108050 RepID=A0A0B7FMF1_THACB|nr:Ras-like GTP-binding protein RYL2 OS=Yarrowia lipolytica (strain CLIB 122 / E 150) GN=RYL2 PE=3 SV=2 [Rhizoctonia solani AG-1 IB]